MKKFLLLLSAVAMYSSLSAQCSVREVPLQDRTANADLIVEGKVLSKNSFWDAAHTQIYTSNKIEVYKIFKGDLQGGQIEVLTEGGVVGDFMIKADPSLQLNPGEVGIFTCETVKRFHVAPVNESFIPQYEAYASVQGFIRYDLQTGIASDVFRTYPDIENGLYSQLGSTFSKGYKVVSPFSVSSSANKYQDPSPSSTITFSPGTVTAGTGTQLTIFGTGFGATRGSGFVSFKNADDGGATFIQPLPSQYIGWSDTQILVEVPSNAGTGIIQVTQGVTQSSVSTLTISYAHLNVDFDPGSGTIAYQTDHIDDNGSGGYTWKMNTAFDADVNARASFMRAFTSWRCTTGINWTIGANTSINDAVSDGTNCICFDNTAPLSAGILGVCYSYWSGCASGPNIVWYVNELDIIFDDGSNITPLTWQYGPSLPTTNQYDFETVAVHELGHGHQLGHVINPGAIMHYAISNGASNRSLSVNDINGGNFVQAKSVVANICGPGAMTAYSCGAQPVAGFTGSPTTVCEGNTVTFTDQSTNTPTSWLWTFQGGTPSTSTAQNPTVTYNTAGTYDVSLTATNSTGSDQLTINGYISVNSCSSPPVADFAGSPTSLCTGGTVSFTDQSTNSPTSWLWTFTGGTPSTSTAQNPTVTYNTPGTYAVSLIATNSSGSDTQTMNGYISVDQTPSASGSVTNVSCNGGNDGAIDLTPSGGQVPYSFVWTPSGQTTEDRTSLTASTYSVVVTDGNGCTVQTSFVVTQPAAMSLNGSVTNVSCNGGNNGAIDLTPSGGQVPYSFVWTPSGQTTEDRSNLTASAYSVVVTDGNGCTAQTSFVVSQPSALSVAMSKTDATCANNDGTATATPSGGTAPYSYAWSPGGQTTQTATGLSAATYTCVVTDNNGCGTSGNIVVNVNGCGPTRLTNASCGITLTTLNQLIYCVPVSGATNYRYRFTNTTLGFNQVFTRGSSSTNFSVGVAYGVQYGYTYNVEVAAYVGGVWSAYGTICTVTTPATMPTTQLTPTYCGITETDLNQQLFCAVVQGATKYEWRITHPASSFSTTYLRNASSEDIRMAWVVGVQYGKTYNVEVRGYVGGAWGAFGSICTVTTPSTIPNTQLTSTYCGITETNLNQQLYCIAIPGATKYEWRITHPASSFSTTYLRNASSEDFNLTWIGGIQYGKTYNFEIRAYVGGVWGSFGPICTVTTPATIPNTQLTPAYCGATLAAVSTQIFCNDVPGASNYQWKVENTSLGYSSTVNRGGSNLNWSLAWNGGILVNTTYSISIRAYVGGVWGNFGTVCSVTTGPVQLISGSETKIPQEVLDANPGMLDQLSEISMNIFPNPNTDGNIFVELGDVPSEGSPVELTLFDICGKQLFTQSSNYSAGEPYLLKTANLSSGIYMVRAIINGRSVFGKIVIE